MSSSVESHSTDVIHSAASVGFGSAESTAAYERGRPSYPVEAVDFLLQQALGHTTAAAPQHTVLHILDVGAGTGIFTRLLAERLQHFTTPSRTFQLTAVEPVAGMRDKFREVTPAHIRVIDGSGANLSTVASDSVAAIFCAQSFHWMSTSATLKEFLRVLQPRGTVALIWNTRDRRTGWVDSLESIIDDYYAPDVPRQQTGAFRRVFAAESAFSPLQSKLIDDGVRQTGDIHLMLDRVMSISVISALPADDKKRAQERITACFTQHPSTAGLSQYTLPYVTESYWCHKL